MFSAKQKRAILEKYYQLRMVEEGILSPDELAEQIRERRVLWIEENKKRMLKKYSHLPLLEKAYNIVFLEHMKIDPFSSDYISVNEKKGIIKSYRFCPYFEACRLLDMDTRDVCKNIGELSIQEMMKRIDPVLKFSRDYDKIRPYNPEFCEEYIELVDA